jgi:hypothetical protein
VVRPRAVWVLDTARILLGAGAQAVHCHTGSRWHVHRFGGQAVAVLLAPALAHADPPLCVSLDSLHAYAVPVDAACRQPTLLPLRHASCPS